MGRVFPGMPLSGQRYQIGVPVPKRDSGIDGLDASDVIASFDIEAVIRASHRIVDDSSNDARLLINDARERAKAIVSKALDMASELETKGYEDGLARAISEQEDVMRKTVSDAREALEHVVENIRQERRQFFINAEREIVDLAIDVAKKILQREIETSPDTTISVVRSALKRLSERDQVTIRVSPADLDAVRSHREEFLHEGDIEDLRIVADPRVDRGGVIIETDSGSIDGRIDAQLHVAKEALLDTILPSTNIGEGN